MPLKPGIPTKTLGPRPPVTDGVIVLSGAEARYRRERARIRARIGSLATGGRTDRGITTSQTFVKRFAAPRVKANLPSFATSTALRNSVDRKTHESMIKMALQIDRIMDGVADKIWRQMEQAL